MINYLPNYTFKTEKKTWKIFTKVFKILNEYKNKIAVLLKISTFSKVEFFFCSNNYNWNEAISLIEMNTFSW